MMQHRSAVVLTLCALATTSTSAAITRSAGPEDNPRVAWLERYQSSRQGSEHTERFAETYKVGSDGTLDLTQIAGDVRVTASRGGEIRVEAMKRLRHRDANEGKRLLDLLRIEVNQIGNRLQIRTIYPRVSGNRSMSASVDYTISVPTNTTIALKTISGDVSVNGVRGEVRAETVSGDVDVVATPNLAVAKTVSGDVRARDIGSETTLTLGTVSGTVIASALKVRALEANSVSGDLELSNLQVERLQAKTVNGDISFDGTLARGGRYEFNAHSGSVRVALADPSGFELDASTFSGSIRSDFPVTLRATPDSGGSRGRSSSNRAVRGTFGDASAILAVRSFSGTVVITKK